MDRTRDQAPTKVQNHQKRHATFLTFCAGRQEAAMRRSYSCVYFRVSCHGMVHCFSSFWVVCNFTIVSAKAFPIGAMILAAPR